MLYSDFKEALAAGGLLDITFGEKFIPFSRPNG